ncbi:MAG: hypothetical protein OHK0038_03670 [Flammeovirgaceae bacterium]
MQTFMVDFALPASMYMLVFALIALVGLTVYNGLQDPKSFVKSLSGFIVVVVICLIGYVFAGDEVTPLYASFGVTPSLSKIIGGMLNATYILFVISMIGIAADSILKFIR